MDKHAEIRPGSTPPADSQACNKDACACRRTREQQTEALDQDFRKQAETRAGEGLR